MIEPPHPPLVILHDHLDGGIRLETLIDLADRYGVALPARSPDELGQWFFAAASGSLAEYLATFDLVLAVLRKPPDVARLSYEAVVDLAADGVIYAESRIAPEELAQHMPMEAVIEAVTSGLEDGYRATGCDVRFVLSALKDGAAVESVADLAVRYRNKICGFDLVGPEVPIVGHASILNRLRRNDIPLTLHAGEDRGVDSIAEALRLGASRLGHGVRIIEDCIVQDGEIVDCGAVADEVLQRRVPLEICPTSNAQTQGMVGRAHPIGALIRAGFNVTVNPDDRTQSQVAPRHEIELVQRVHELDASQTHQLVINAVDAAFVDEATRSLIRQRVFAGTSGYR